MPRHSRRISEDFSPTRPVTGPCRVSCGSEGDASAATVAHLVDTVKQQQLSAVLHIEFSNKNVANAIAETAGVEMKQLHSCHNVTKEELQNGISYLTLMEQNIETLNEVLN